MNLTIQEKYSAFLPLPSVLSVLYYHLVELVLGECVVVGVKTENTQFDSLPPLEN